MAHGAGNAVKGIIFTVLLAVCLLPKLAAAEEWDELTRDLPEEVTDYMEEDAADGWRRGLGDLGQRAVVFFSQELTEGVQGAASLLLIVIAASVAEGAMTATGDGKAPNYVPVAAALAVTAVSVGRVQSLAAACGETLEQLHVLSELLIPAMATAMAATGGVVSASLRQVATVFISQALVSLTQNVLMPMAYIFIASSAADIVLPGHHFAALAQGVRKAVTWALSGCVLLYTGYLTVGGAAAGGTDRLALQATRSVISAAVPVVGGIISDASGMVLAGAETIKNTMGIAGLLGVLGICLGPFLSILVKFLLFKAVALLSGVMGTSLSPYLEAIGSAYALMLGMVGSGALVLMISISTFLSAVMT